MALSDDVRERARQRLVFALDIDDPDEAIAMAGRLRGDLRWIKVATRLYTRAGAPLIASLTGMGFNVFLDLKFHDIPDQVEGACRAAARLGVGLLTVHASGGEAMLRAANRGAAEGAELSGNIRPEVLAVTVLTSLDRQDLDTAGISRSVEEQVLALAHLAQDSGCAGIVASPKELPQLRGALPSPFKILTPGIRPRGASHGDQKRVLTPQEAVHMGADWLVVGRPIRTAENPTQALRAIVEEMAEGEASR